MKNVGQLTQMSNKAANSKHGGAEYTSDKLELPFGKVPAPGAFKTKLEDGPYGGKKPQSGK